SLHYTLYLHDAHPILKVAEAYGLSQEKIENIKRAAVLHDIGKIAINDSILHKASRLTREEYEQIMKHPSVGADIISEIDFLKDRSEEHTSELQSRFDL